MLLVVLLAGCDGARSEQTPPALDGTHDLTPNATAAFQPTATNRPSRYATRTPAATTPEATPTAVETLPVQAEQLSGRKVTFWHAWPGAQGEVLRQLVDEYNRSNPWQVSVEVRAFDSFSGLEQAFVTSLAAGDPPSLLVVYDDRAQHWDASGQTLVNLQAYVSDPTWGMSAEEQADFYPQFWQQGVAYGRESGAAGTRLLSIPLHRSQLVLVYNQSWAAELGYTELPLTPFKLRSQVCAAADVQRGAVQEGEGGLMLSTLPASTPGRGIILQPEQLLGWIGAFGGQVELPQGAGYQFNTPEALRALEFLKDLQVDRCLFLNDSPTPADDFATRRGLLYIASSAELPMIQAAFEAAGNQDEWLMLPFPTANGAAGVVAYGPSLILPRTGAAQQVAAWTLLKWLVEPSNQARWVQAIGAYPTRLSTRDLLGEAAAADPRWGAGLDLLAGAQAEPSLPSWRVVRWMLGDALAELVSPALTLEQIPALLEELDLLSAEVNTQIR